MTESRIWFIDLTQTEQTHAWRRELIVLLVPLQRKFANYIILKYNFQYCKYSAVPKIISLFLYADFVHTNYDIINIQSSVYINQLHIQRSFLMQTPCDQTSTK